MKRVHRVSAVLTLSLLLSTCSFGAKVKKRSGETVEGTIRGLIVVKLFSTVERAKDTAIYEAFQGADVLVINEKGFQVAAGKTLYLRVLTDEATGLPLDGAILQMALKQRTLKVLSKLQKSEMESMQFPGGHLFVCADCLEEQIRTQPYRLLGEFRPGEGWGTIVPAIEIQATNGLVAIPVSEVIEPSDPSVPTVKQPEKPVVEKTEVPTSTETEASAQAIVIAAKTASVIASKGIGRGSDPGADSARKDVEGELKKWGRYTVVSDMAQADLIFTIVAFETGEELAILQGGATPGRSGRLLWLRDVRGEFALRAVRFFRKEIEEAEKQQKK